MAVRALAGGPSRVIVQEESHLYQDEGDCAQTLSNLVLMPLAAGRATFTADEVQHVIDQTKGGRVVSRVSAISIETPVRRKQGEHFDSGELSKVIALAKREGIRLHLDGARLFLQAAYTGEDVAVYSRPFDTVYVSLYKYFNAASGAMLAGPRDIIDGMFHTRRMLAASITLAVRARRTPLSGRLRRSLGGRWARRTGSAPCGRTIASRSIALPSARTLRLQVRGIDPAAFRKRLEHRR
jgi:threonine aldolase